MYLSGNEPQKIKVQEDKEVKEVVVEEKEIVRRNKNKIIGVVTILVGVMVLLIGLLSVNFIYYFWPLLVAIPGVFLFIFSFIVKPRSENMAITGSIITMIGLLFFYQNIFNHFESWTYAWSLVLPISIGLAQLIYGSINKDWELFDKGERLIKIGLIIFITGYIFFELIIGISGLGLILDSFGWGILIIVIGVVIFINGYIPPKYNLWWLLLLVVLLFVLMFIAQHYLYQPSHQIFF